MSIGNIINAVNDVREIRDVGRGGRSSKHRGSSSSSGRGSKQLLVFPESIRDDSQRPTVRFLIENNLAPQLDGKSVHLYLPNGITTSDSASYGEVELGVANMLENLKDGKTEDSKGLQSIVTKKMGDAGGSIGSGLAAKEALRARRVANPEVTSSFNSVGIRTFSFEFNFVPETPAEASTIKNIENFFRDNLYPTEEGDSLIYPSIFQIGFYFGSGLAKYLPMIYKSYLTGLTTIHNESTNLFHVDGAPVETKLSVSFSETKALSRQKGNNNSELG